METKEIKITPPDGYEIDRENSTFECIKFKPKSKRTYRDIIKELFKRRYWYVDTRGAILDTNNDIVCVTDPNNATSRKQLEKLLAINKLMNVAKYLNNGWQPDWNDGNEKKVVIMLFNGYITSTDVYYTSYAPVYFKTKYLAEQAIEILGKDTIRLALSTDW